MDGLSIRKAIEQITAGSIRIPAFQRGFVWDAERVAYLMDSIYKGYPFGAIILWRTREQLKVERELGPYQLPSRDPEYPIDYVLDGQQRLTSVFGVFQTDLTAVGDDSWTKIYFDRTAAADLQETQFFALQDAEVDPQKHFPIGTFFDVTAYRKATEGLNDQEAELIDSVQAVFKEAVLPVQEIATDNRAKVAIVFERVNRMGMPLDVLQLLSAWTWSEEFDLQNSFTELADDLKPFGFEDVGEDTNLLLRCCAAVVAGDASPTALIGLNGADVRTRFPEIVNGIRGAIDFLRTNLNVETLDNLPYSTFLVPLATFFAAPDGKHVNLSDTQRQTLIRWFWRACFSRRYSAGVLRTLKRDIEECRTLRDNGKSGLDDFAVNVDSEFFSGQRFTIGTVHTRTFVLMLAQQEPRSFVSGAAISLANVLQRYNRNEFHHLYPRSYLRAAGVDSARINVLANFAFMSAADNNTLGGDAPSVYRAKMPPASVDAILAHAVCPTSLFDDDYGKFVTERAAMLASAAQGLIA